MVVDLNILITEPQSSMSVREEAALIEGLLRDGVFARVHLRKPGDARRVRALLEEIAPDVRPRLSVHRFPELAREFGLWYHCADSEPEPAGLVCTHSCHRPADLAAHAGAPYCFLSPIFPSISKEGYTPAFTIAELSGPYPCPVVGLGGITPARLLSLRAMGCAGGAMLGYAWRRLAVDPAGFVAEMRRFSRAVAGFRLQYITSAHDAASTAAGAIEAMRGGCRWVQVRMKDAPDAEVRRAVELIAPEARRRSVTLLVDDRVELAARMDAVDGVHLGHADMPRAEARAILGAYKIIGSTANTVEQALALAPLSDYLGVGPFRFTTTKKNLAPVLGAEGIERVAAALKRASLPVPVTAIGGILPADVPTLMRAGASGIAVSGAIHAAAHPERAARELVKLTEL